MDAINLSQRCYQVAFIESDIILVERHTLETILNNKEDYEWKYSLAYKVDEFLDLHPGQRMSFLSNRDNPDSLAIVLRTK